MSTLVTKQFKNLLATQIYNLLDVSANTYLPTARKSYVYAVLGKQIPWNVGTEVAGTPTESITDYNNYYKRGIYAKQITFDNASIVVPRINWTTGEVYNTYESSSDFYVLNSSDQVFKCLSNVSIGTASTSEPALSLSTTSLEEPYVETADGYKWKYMYTLTSVQKQKFLSDDWMPVTYNKFVRAAAIDKSIDIVNIINSGNNYTNGATQAIISISGDGTGAVLKANVDGGQIADIVIQERGTGYTFADLTVTDVVGGSGSSAQLTVSLAPNNGHGYDPVEELNGTTLMFTVEFDGNESGNLPTDNDYREISLIQNPYTYGTTTLATSSAYTLYTKIKVSPGTGNFTADEIVYQGTNLSESTFRGEVISFDTTNNFLYLNNVSGSLVENTAMKGYTTGSIRIVNSYSNPTLKPYSGKVLYISDKLPVSRDTSQTDRIRFILSF